jgi:large subunit ribosomal protein L17
MRHHKNHRKFNRTTNQRKALLSNLAVSLIEKERIMTTLPKAKEIRPFVEKLITKGTRTPSLAAFQTVYRTLRHLKASHKVVSDLGPRFQSRLGGYLRIIKAGFRYGDQAPLALIEFVDYQGPAVHQDKA